MMYSTVFIEAFRSGQALQALVASCILWLFVSWLGRRYLGHLHSPGWQRACSLLRRRRSVLQPGCKHGDGKAHDVHASAHGTTHAQPTRSDGGDENVGHASSTNSTSSLTPRLSHQLALSEQEEGQQEASEEFGSTGSVGTAGCDAQATWEADADELAPASKAGSVEAFTLVPEDEASAAWGQGCDEHAPGVQSVHHVDTQRQEQQDDACVCMREGHDEAASMQHTVCGDGTGAQGTSALTSLGSEGVSQELRLLQLTAALGGHVPDTGMAKAQAAVAGSVHVPAAEEAPKLITPHGSGTQQAETFDRADALTTGAAAAQPPPTSYSSPPPPSDSHTPQQPHTSATDTHASMSTNPSITVAGMGPADHTSIEPPEQGDSQAERSSTISPSPNPSHKPSPSCVPTPFMSHFTQQASGSPFQLSLPSPGRSPRLLHGEAASPGCARHTHSSTPSRSTSLGGAAGPHPDYSMWLMPPTLLAGSMGMPRVGAAGPGPHTLQSAPQLLSCVPDAAGHGAISDEEAQPLSPPTPADACAAGPQYPTTPSTGHSTAASTTSEQATQTDAPSLPRDQPNASQPASPVSSALAASWQGSPNGSPNPNGSGYVAGTSAQRRQRRHSVHTVHVHHPQQLHTTPHHTRLTLHARGGGVRVGAVRGVVTGSPDSPHVATSAVRSAGWQQIHTSSLAFLPLDAEEGDEVGQAAQTEGAYAVRLDSLGDGTGAAGDTAAVGGGRERPIQRVLFGTAGLGLKGKAYTGDLASAAGDQAMHAPQPCIQQAQATFTGSGSGSGLVAAGSQQIGAAGEATVTGHAPSAHIPSTLVHGALPLGFVSNELTAVGAAPASGAVVEARAGSQEELLLNEAVVWQRRAVDAEQRAQRAQADATDAELQLVLLEGELAARHEAEASLRGEAEELRAALARSEAHIQLLLDELQLTTQLLPTLQDEALAAQTHVARQRVQLTSASGALRRALAQQARLSRICQQQGAFAAACLAALVRTVQDERAQQQQQQQVVVVPLGTHQHAGELVTLTSAGLASDVEVSGRPPHTGAMDQGHIAVKATAKAAPHAALQEADPDSPAVSEPQPSLLPASRPLASTDSSAGSCDAHAAPVLASTRAAPPPTGIASHPQPGAEAPAAGGRLHLSGTASHPTGTPPSHTNFLKKGTYKPPINSPPASPTHPAFAGAAHGSNPAGPRPTKPSFMTQCFRGSGAVSPPHVKYPPHPHLPATRTAAVSKPAPPASATTLTRQGQPAHGGVLLPSGHATPKTTITATSKSHSQRTETSTTVASYDMAHRGSTAASSLLAQSHVASVSGTSVPSSRNSADSQAEVSSKLVVPEPHALQREEERAPDNGGHAEASMQQSMKACVKGSSHANAVGNATPTSSSTHPGQQSRKPQWH